MTEPEAIDAANLAAQSAGLNLNDYDAPVAELVDGNWEIFYHGKSRRPGDHFDVLVNDGTGATEVSMGR